MAEVTKVKRVELVDGIKGPMGDVVKVVCLKDVSQLTAGSLKVMDGKGEHEGLQAFIASIATTEDGKGLTPSMISGAGLRDYGILAKVVRDFLSVLKGE